MAHSLMADHLAPFQAMEFSWEGSTRATSSNKHERFRSILVQQSSRETNLDLQ